MGSQKVELIKQCLRCEREFGIEYYADDYLKWLEGTQQIDEAIPYLTDDEYSLITRGMCSNCFLAALTQSMKQP